MTQIKSIEIFKGYTEDVDDTSSDCVSGTSIPLVALSPLPANAKSGAKQIVPKCVFSLPYLETLLKYLKQQFYSAYTFSWNIQDSTLVDGCDTYNCFCNVVIPQQMSGMAMKGNCYSSLGCTLRINFTPIRCVKNGMIAVPHR